MFPVRTQTLPAGHICATEDLDTLHLSNLQPAGADLTTLHIYSPPLLVMVHCSLSDSTVREFEDEAFTLTEGAGIGCRGFFFRGEFSKRICAVNEEPSGNIQHSTPNAEDSRSLGISG